MEGGEEEEEFIDELISVKLGIARAGALGTGSLRNWVSLVGGNVSFFI